MELDLFRYREPGIFRLSVSLADPAQFVLHLLHTCLYCFDRYMQLTTSNVLSITIWDEQLQTGQISSIACPNKYQEITDKWSALKLFSANINVFFVKLRQTQSGRYISER